VFAIILEIRWFSQVTNRLSRPDCLRSSLIAERVPFACSSCRFLAYLPRVALILEESKIMLLEQTATRFNPRSMPSVFPLTGSIGILFSTATLR